MSASELPPSSPESKKKAGRPRSRLLRFLLALAIMVLLAELAARLSGVTDFPVYLTDREIGYIPAPNQAGKFLNRNDWKFNALSMGAGPYEPHQRPNVLLISDSIVYGGNPYRQSEKLGPQMEEQAQRRLSIWPIGAGSWAATNEMTYIERHRDLLPDLQALVWVVNSGDFADRSQWDNDYNHPRSRPALASLYAFGRYVRPMLPAWLRGASPETAPPPPAADFDRYLPDFEKFLHRLATENPRMAVTVAWYPSLEQERILHGTQADSDPEHFHELSDELAAACRKAGVGFVDVFHAPEWGPTVYRDSMHPTPAGYQILARLLVGKALTPLLSSTPPGAP
jgi:hypothetical protein